jgi:hypothetical protein
MYIFVVKNLPLTKRASLFFRKGYDLTKDANNEKITSYTNVYRAGSVCHADPRPYEQILR